MNPQLWKAARCCPHHRCLLWLLFKHCNNPVVPENNKQRKARHYICQTLQPGFGINHERQAMFLLLRLWDNERTSHLYIAEIKSGAIPPPFWWTSKVNSEGIPSIDPRDLAVSGLGVRYPKSEIISPFKIIICLMVQVVLSHYGS